MMQLICFASITDALIVSYLASLFGEWAMAQCELF